ncbi:MAG: hypothetical protein OXG38_04365 [Chloroflexi bacterium]|nr:hypothetical protein [Chloroflexota bacterium]
MVLNNVIMRRLVRRGRPKGWGTLAAILTLLLTASTLGLGSTPAHAQGGVFPLPAEAGSVWTIVAGYNTLTHSVADRNDPHAIDIVREDAATEGSVVLAPITGTISYVGPDCLTINNGAGLAVLICHIFPEPSLYRGLPVQVGHDLGTVAPAYYANNGGLPHIHLAVHRTIGGGRIRESIPLTGAWAVEGIDLPQTHQFNAHAGTRFTSSNGTGATPTQGSPPDAGSGDPENGPSVDESAALLQLQPGWNMVGWTARTPAAEIAAALGDSLGAIFGFDAVAQEFRRFRPGVPAHVNDLSEVVPGAGLLVRIEGPGAVLPLPANGRPLEQPLHRGFNLVAWTGAAATMEQAMSSLGDALVAAFWWDPVAQEYRTYRPGLPMFSDLKEVAPAQALWLRLDADATWNPGEAAPADGDLLRVVVSDCLNLRPAPSLNTTPILCLKPGTPLRSLGETEVDETGREWVRVAAEGRAGWVAREFTTPSQRPGTAAPAANSGTDPNGPPAHAVAGDATFYHHSLAGNVMRCGGIYDPNDPTIAASTTYDCGTRLRVWRGMQYVDVTVQDTGRFPVNDIDLSPAAFNKIGIPAEGRIRVHVEVLSQPGQ